MVRAIAMARPNKAVKYQGTAGPSAQSMRGPLLFASSPSARQINNAKPSTDANTVKPGPAHTRVKKYRHDATPAPVPIANEKSNTLCRDQRSGCGNIQRSKPNPASQIAARHSSIMAFQAGRALRQCRHSEGAADDWPSAAS